ncbi:hypothetical protein WJX72_003492 [[Myrmecia] bisecta]|uniref:Uncharacterized protein n=1 Tax=[Myrmecia] bisecta TaxID=41462 RepID=A0AAW1PPJ1_9CHLO
MDLSGLLCRVIVYTNLTYDAVNTVTLELATPRFVDPHGMQLCMPSSYTVDSDHGFALTSLQEGGNQTSPGSDTVELIPSGAAPADVNFFSTAAEHQPMQFGTLNSTLATDRYFSRSFIIKRYDDFIQDVNGAPLQVFVAAALLNSSASQSSSNCFLLTGKWKAGTRYQLTWSVRNPAAPAGSTSATMPAPAVWIAPLTYLSSSDISQGIRYIVRGDKYGLSCPLRSATTAVLTCSPAANCPNPPYAASLGAELCANFTQASIELHNGQLSDAIVGEEYLNAYVERASYLNDTGMMLEANETFWSTLYFDERHLASPTRQHGLWPNCNRCQDGQFTDLWTGNQVPVYDRRFKAVHTLRFIGYLLLQNGYPCPALFDPNDAFKGIYGKYNAAHICKPL